MPSRSSNRNRIHWLEAFVAAWDDFVATSQHANTMNPTDPEYARLRALTTTKQQEVIRARSRVGNLDAQ